MIGFSCHARKRFVSGAILLTLVGVASRSEAQHTLLRFGDAQGLVTWSKFEGPSGQLFAGSTPGSSALVDVIGPPAIYEANVSWAFTADFVAGSAKNLGGGIKSAEFNNGAFNFTGMAGNILSGTFTRGILVSNQGFLSFAVGGSNIYYTGGYALDSMGLGILGNMEMMLAGTGLGSSGFGISPNGNITNSTFSGQANGVLDVRIPEPGEWAAMGVLSGALAGLVLKRRRGAVA